MAGRLSSRLGMRGVITGLDHIVILVDDLAHAVTGYERLGFAVHYGGVHPAWGTENALIPLADGTYLELLAARDPAAARGHRLWRRADSGTRQAGEYGGYALLSDDLDVDVAAARRRGLTLADPQPGQRQRPDGVVVRWRLAFAGRPDLPFLITDDTPRKVRVAQPQQGLNVDTSIASVAVVVDDLESAVAAYEQLLGTPRGRNRETGRVQYAVGRWRLAVESPPQNSPAGQYLERAGSGLCSVTLAVGHWAAVRARDALIVSETGSAAFDPAATGGVAILLTSED